MGCQSESSKNGETASAIGSYIEAAVTSDVKAVLFIPIDPRQHCNTFCWREKLRRSNNVFQNITLNDSQTAAVATELLSPLFYHLNDYYV